jgi:ankyrin repeat protein
MKYVSALLCLAAFPAVADINERFYETIRAGDTPALRELLKSGADPNVKDARGASPLFYAATVGTPEAMGILIAAGADVNARTAFGATPLMWSTADLAKVRLLVEKGADVNAQSKAGNTALLIASAQAGNLEILRYLFEHGASIQEARNEMGETPLLRAAATDDLGMVKLLIEKGNNSNAQDAGGRTPLLRASAHGNVEIVKLLLSKDADVNAQSKPQFAPPVKHGFVEIGSLTPLIVSVVSGSPATVKLLLDAGADVNPRDVRGMTPLMLAVASDHANPDIVHMLLAKRPDISLKSKSGETALQWAENFQDRATLSQIHSASSASHVPGVANTAAEPSGLRDVRQAAERGLALVQKTTANFFREGGCVSCHAQHITGVAVAVAKSKGIPVDEGAAGRRRRHATAGREVRRVAVLKLIASILLAGGTVASASQLYTFVDFSYGVKSGSETGEDHALLPLQSFQLGVVTATVNGEARADFLSLGSYIFFSSMNTAPILVTGANATAEALEEDVVTAGGAAAGTPGSLVLKFNINGSNLDTLTGDPFVGSAGSLAQTQLFGCTYGPLAQPSAVDACSDNAPTIVTLNSLLYANLPVELTFPIVFGVRTPIVLGTTSSAAVTFDPNHAISFNLISNFLDTADLVSVQLLDGNGKPVLSPSLVSESGTNYPLGGAGGGSSVPEPRFAWLSAAACLALYGVFRKRNRLSAGGNHDGEFRDAAVWSTHEATNRK